LPKGQPETYEPVYLTSAYFNKHTMHWHEDLQFILVLEGMVHLKIGYESIDLKARDIMLINSNEIHSIESADDPTKVVFLYLYSDYVQQICPGFYEAVASCPFRKAFEQTNKNRRKLYGALELVLANLQNRDSCLKAEYDQKLSESVCELLSILFDCHKPTMVNAKRGQVEVSDDKIKMINRLLKSLRDNSDHKINLKEFAEDEFISMYHLSRCIKEVTGCSFRSWISYYRLEKAEKMLLTTDWSLAEIADQCGFSDVRYFVKQFEEWHKISPEEFRKNYWQDEQSAYETITEIERRSLLKINELSTNDFLLQGKVLSTSDVVGSGYPDLYFFSGQGTFAYLGSQYGVREEGQLLSQRGQWLLTGKILVLSVMEEQRAYGGEPTDDLLLGEILTGYQLVQSEENYQLALLRVIYVISPGEQNYSRPDETANIVNMTVGFVIIDTPGQPDYFLHVQVVT
jgi:AraC-like DNA-binding protein